MIHSLFICCKCTNFISNSQMFLWLFNEYSTGWRSAPLATSTILSTSTKSYRRWLQPDGFFFFTLFLLIYLCLPLLKCVYVAENKWFSRNFTSILPLLYLYFASTLHLLIFYQLSIKRKKVWRCCVVLNDTIVKISIRWKNCSHGGNMVFPCWEHNIPTVGTYYKPKAFCV